MTDSIHWLQFTIPSPSAHLLAAACAHTMADTEVSEEQYKVLSQLRDFFEHAADNPRGFVPTGTMATSLKIRARRVDGVRRNDGSLKDGTPRAKRTARRKAAHKKRRATRAEDAASFNAARDIIQRELSEVEGERSLTILERIRRHARSGPGRAEGEDPAPDVQGQ